MKHIFEIHNDFGRLFDEKIYKRELAARLPGVDLEAHVKLVYRTFSKSYFADAIAWCCGLFEIKAVEALTPRHSAQAINYLLLFDLAHGKLINVRPERVEHEFCHFRIRRCNGKPTYARALEIRTNARTTVMKQALHIIRETTRRSYGRQTVVFGVIHGLATVATAVLLVAWGRWRRKPMRRCSSRKPSYVPCIHFRSSPRRHLPEESQEVTTRRSARLRN